MQFMPSTWARYGVDVNRDGFRTPTTPPTRSSPPPAISSGRRRHDIRAAIFAYNHSQAYVNSVMLRARLLGGTPPALLGAITGLTEARFPVYAAAHYSDGFPSTEGASPGASPHTVPGTTIYTQANAPAIAVQDGRIVRIVHSGRSVRLSLRDAYGNTYTYAELGSSQRSTRCSKRSSDPLAARPPGAHGALRAPRPARALPARVERRRAPSGPALRTSTCTRCTSAPR